MLRSAKYVFPKNCSGRSVCPMKGMKSGCLLLVEKTIWHQANTIESLALQQWHFIIKLTYRIPSPAATDQDAITTRIKEKFRRLPDAFWCGAFFLSPAHHLDVFNARRNQEQRYVRVATAVITMLAAIIKVSGDY
jgi:hypothetical protein